MAQEATIKFKTHNKCPGCDGTGIPLALRNTNSKLKCQQCLGDGKETITLVQGAALINTKHPNGTPALVTIIQETQNIDLAGGEEFLLFWADKKMIRK